jgi:hypothetical protein
MTTKVSAAMADADVGRVVQVAHTQTGAYATGNTAMPLDNTIPQITEGTEFMTLAITPTSATNILYIEALLHITAGAADTINVALFKAGTNDALAVTSQGIGASNVPNGIVVRYRMVAGTTSPITFSVRAGDATTGSMYFNGLTTGQLFGGTLMSSITITEIKA